ncbi:MAG: T9SS type A sorting domain-containing protein [Chloroherpetonaceae bacterium]
MKHVIFIVSLLLVAATLLGYFVYRKNTSTDEQALYAERIARKANKKPDLVNGFAGAAFEWWYGQRAYPNELIDYKKFEQAYQYSKSELVALRSPDSTVWQSLGPNNVGGRTRAIAIHPLHPDTMWAGAASGGLWKSTTAGAGANAWQYVETGFPSVSVSAIAIDTTNPNVMYIGTGEFRRYNQPGMVGTPGARATYGIGILKSTDGGNTWSQTGLNWSLEEYKAIQRIVINPKNSQTLYTATSDGVYKSTNGGATWTLSLNVPAAMDIVINPIDTSVLYAACGQLNTAPNPGLYKTTDAGATWTKLSGGLPTTNFGRTALALYAAPRFIGYTEVVYAGIGHAQTRGVHGVYRTTNGGTTWTLQSTEQYAASQSWYDNAIAVHPENPNIVFASGLDFYKSTDGGTTLVRKSQWYAYFQGVVEPGGEEGSPVYAHADHHAIVFHPFNPNRMFLATDGGIFETTDGGETFRGRNGGYQTTQIYNGFASSLSDSNLAYAGLQDNGTLKYEGTRAWNKVFGGDGGWCAINAQNTQTAYLEYVYLDIYRTTNGGATWTSATNGIEGGSSNANFIAPFIISPSNPNILYAGATKIFKTTDGGLNWFATNNNQAINGNRTSAMAISWTNPDTLYAATGTSTATTSNGLCEVFFSSNGGATWVNRTQPGMPDRYPTDLYVDPRDSKIAYLTYSGYGNPHIYKTTNAGETWQDISSNLPDIPVQCVALDGDFPDDVYIGTDLGVYRRLNGGVWELWDQGMPTAMILDLQFSRPNRTMRAATFGNGVYERKLRPIGQVSAPTPTPSKISDFTLEQNYPNPFNPTTTIRYAIPTAGQVRLELFDVLGRKVATLVNQRQAAGTHTYTLNAARYALASGTYFYRLQVGNQVETKKMMLVK